MLATRGRPEACELADVFCRAARVRILEHFKNLFGRNDARQYRLAQQVLDGEFAWLEEGIVGWDAAQTLSRSKTMDARVGEMREPATVGR
jgi:hypothetical protein